MNSYCFYFKKKISWRNISDEKPRNINYSETLPHFFKKEEEERNKEKKRKRKMSSILGYREKIFNKYLNYCNLLNHIKKNNNV